mgnify:CR=1 FL=1
MRLPSLSNKTACSSPTTLREPILNGTCMQLIARKFFSVPAFTAAWSVHVSSCHSCRHSSDGECDDGGEGATFAICDLGTDCADCEERLVAPPPPLPPRPPPLPPRPPPKEHPPPPPPPSPSPPVPRALLGSIRSRARPTAIIATRSAHRFCTHTALLTRSL